MSLLKTTHLGLKWLPGFIVIATLLGASLLVYLEWSPGENDWLSQGSMHKLHALNSEHEMVIDSLLEEHWYLQADLFQTNSLEIKQLEDENHQGLLITIDDQLVDNGFLLLQPKEYLTERELESVAEAYESSIPEFVNVEVDQNIQLQGEAHYWVVPDEFVDLADELFTEVETEEAEKIQVGVIDSGIDPYHEIFENVEILTGWNTITDDTIMYDDVGHGTHIAGILANESENIQIIPYKIVDSSGGRLSNVLEAFSKAIEDQPDVINASFGLMSNSYSLEVMMQEAYLDGIIVVAAAGNNDSSKGFYPASYETTLAIASLTTDGTAMDKSNYGNWVDLAANGQAILSALPDDRYGYKSGTSQSAALVSARIANLLQTEGYWSFENVIAMLRKEENEIQSGKLAGVSIVD